MYGDISPRPNYWGQSVQISDVFVDEAGPIDPKVVEELGKRAAENIESHMMNVLKAGTSVHYADSFPMVDSVHVDIYEDEHEDGFVICPYAGNYAYCDGCPCSEVHHESECDGSVCMGYAPECEPIDQEKCDDIHEQYDRYHPVTIEPRMPSTTTYGDISPRTAGYAAIQLLKAGQQGMLLKKFGSTGSKLPVQSARKTIKFRRYYTP